MDGHRVYVRLPIGAKLSAEQGVGSIAIDCPPEGLDELCKWLRLTADSLDGKLSASELGYLQELVEEQADARGKLRAIEACQRYAQEHPADALTATRIAENIARNQAVKDNPR